MSYLKSQEICMLFLILNGSIKRIELNWNVILLDIVKFDNHGSTFQKTRKLSYWMEVIEPRLEVTDHMLGESLDEITRDSGYLDDRGPTSRHRSNSLERSSTLPRPQSQLQGPMKGLSRNLSFI